MILHSFVKLFCFLCASIVFSQCLPIEQEERTISFWTSKEFDLNVQTVLYVNNIPVGKFTQTHQDPMCADNGLITIPVESAEDMFLVIRNEEGEKHHLGLINLYNPSHGIIIKPETTGGIFVQHDLDEACTRVRLKW